MSATEWQIRMLDQRAGRLEENRHRIAEFRQLHRARRFAAEVMIPAMREAMQLRLDEADRRACGEWRPL